MRLSFSNFVFSILFISVFLFSCSSSETGNDKTKKSAYKNLPKSSGQIDEVILVMDDAYWKGELGNVLREILAEDYPALPQSEPRFDLRQIPYKAFKDLFKRGSTIVFVSPTNCDSDLCRHTKAAFENYTKQGNDFLISFKDVYASPQKVVYLSAPDASGLASNILANDERILKAVSEIENQKALRSALASRENSSFAKAVSKKCFVDATIPKSYRKVIEADSLYWFRQDLEEAVSNLVFHVKQFPKNFDDADFDVAQFIIDARNEYGEAYVKSDTEGSFMTTETNFEPDFKPAVINVKTVIESRGLWYLTKDYMGGPFLNYAYFDKANDRVVLMDAWIYAPKYDKRPQIRRLEQLMQNANFL